MLAGARGHADRTQQIVDWPAAQVELLHGFLAQNDGCLSHRGRDKEFAALTDEEVAPIEVIYEEALTVDE
mgnify:CR=1 FL=1